jgi:hypothetical protein
MLEARHMIVRNKLMVPNGAGNATGWSMTSIVHLPRFAPQVALGSEAVFKVGWRPGTARGGAL